MNGWIKIHRKMLEWEWFTEPDTVLVFLFLLLSAKREYCCYKGIDLEPGQCITSRSLISLTTGLSDRKIRTSLERLEATNEVTIKTTSKFSVVTICKYADYQFVDECERPTVRPTNRPANDQQTTSNNIKKERIEENKEENILSKDNIKEEKKERSYHVFKKPTVEQIDMYCRERNNGIDAQSFFDFYESKGWVVGRSPMKDWKAAVRTWEAKRTHEDANSGGMNTGVILKEKPKYTKGW